MLDLKKRSFWRTHVLIFLALLIIHLVFSFANQDLIALPDELGYWGQARYLAGGLPVNFFNAPYYNFGYSLWLAPFFLFLQDTASIYLSSIWLNNILMSAVYFGLYYIIRNIYGAERKTAMVVALVSSLYPSFLVQTNFIMSENAFIPIFILTVIWFYKFLEKSQIFYLILFSLSSVFLYAVHPRAIAVPLVALFLMLFLKAYGRISKKTISCYIFSTATFLFIIIWINSHLVQAGWTHTNSYTLSKLWPVFMSVEGLSLFFSGIGGQFLYLLIGTFGIFVLGLYFLWQRLGLRENTLGQDVWIDRQKIIILFIFFSSFSIVMISWCLPLFANLYGFLRADHIFYGRYNESFIIFYIAAGLLALVQQRVRKYYYILGLFLLSWPIDIVYENIDKQNAASTFSTWAVSPFFYLSDSQPILLAAIFSALVFLALVFLASYKSKLPLFILAIIFVSFSFLNQHILLENRRRVYKASEFSMTQYIKDYTGIQQISFDMSFTDREDPNWQTWYISAYYYQYHFPNIRFEQFYSEDGQTPKYAHVISREDWRPSEDKEAEIIFRDEAVGQVLWRVAD